MPRPQSKEELLFLAKENYEKLLSYINTLPENKREINFPEGTMNRNIRDVLGHLYHWHLLFLKWYEVGMQGEKPAIPKEGYTFSQMPQLNREIWQKCQSVSLSQMLLFFEQTHRQVYKIIEKHTDEELFTKKKYRWTGTTSLGSYLVSASSSHYDWALKLIRKAVSVKK